MPTLTPESWRELPAVEFKPGEHMIACDDDTVFLGDLDEYLARELEAGRDPADRLPVIADWHPATIDGDDIRGAIEEMLPDEDRGGDPIHEAQVCKEAAAAAQAVLDAHKMGAYWPTKQRPIFGDEWEARIRAKYALFPFVNLRPTSHDALDAYYAAQDEATTRIGELS